MKNIFLKKIPLKLFIESLIEVYNEGADFVDLLSNQESNNGGLGIVVREEYLDMEGREDNEEDNILTQDDINQLIRS